MMAKKINIGCIISTLLSLLCIFNATSQASGATAVGSVGKCFLLQTAGSLTSDSTEVISGQRSIKGSYSGTQPVTSFLVTDSTTLNFSPSQTYTVTFQYKILSAPSQSFGIQFYSPTAFAAGYFLQVYSITGKSGDTGVVTLTSTLGPYTDYSALWNMMGTGEIAIDDIQITNVATGQAVASENAEGPAIYPGILNFQTTDAQTFTLDPGPQTSGSIIRSATVKDLDGDGYPEAIFTFTTGPIQIPLPVMIIGAKTGISLNTNKFFPDGAPTVKHSPVTLFADINGDGLQDILFADEGQDGITHTSVDGTGSVIGVGLNMGGGKYQNISSLIPADLQNTRSYSLAFGDIDGDGRVEIILPDNYLKNTALLRWTGSGFTPQYNWVDPNLWWSGPTLLNHQASLGAYDFNNDGKLDLIIGGVNTTPNLRIFFNNNNGFFDSSNILQLPDGPFGYAPLETWFDPSVKSAQGGDVDGLLVADFNNDGLLDVFSIQQQIIISTFAGAKNM